MSACRLDDIAACRAREVGVVEHEPPNTRRERFVECLSDLAQGSSTLVTVEPQVATGDVFHGNAALPGSRNAHDQDHVRIVGLPRPPACPTRLAKGAL